MQGVILAAGKGSRLHPITLTRSKAMAPALGQPMVERVMHSLTQNGVREFILVIHPDDQEIQQYFQKQGSPEIDLHFVFQAERLGMAHALSLAAPYINETFILSACDNLIPIKNIADLLTTHRTAQAQATLSLMEVTAAQVERTGIVDWRQGRVRRIVEKPSLAEAPSRIASLPLYVFSTRILEYLPAVQVSSRGEYELQDAIQMMIDNDHYVTGALTKTRLQLTNAKDLLALNYHYLTTDNTPPRVTPDRVGHNTRLITPLRIDEGTTIGPDCVIGPNVYIEPGCHIGANVHLSRAVVLRHTTIAPNQRFVDQVVDL